METNQGADLKFGTYVLVSHRSQISSLLLPGQWREQKPTEYEMGNQEISIIINTLGYLNSEYA